MGSSYKLDSESRIWLGELLPGRNEQLLRAHFQEKDEQAYSKIHTPGEITLPLSIFFTDVSVMQVVVKYLHDVVQLSFDEIASRLQRSYPSIWTTYQKYPEGVSLAHTSSKIQIPISIFTNRTLGPLEALSSYLKSLGFSYAKIGSLLKKDERTIWTSFNRAQKKIGEGEYV